MPPKPGSRAFWSGTITFGLVSVPVELFSANISRPRGLRMVAEDGTPLERRYFCSKEGVEVPWKDLTRGYETEDGELVEVTDEELEALEPQRSRDIDLRTFVPRESLDPLYFKRAYYLVPGGDSVKAYRLLVEAMSDADRAGLATFVMRGKEYLVAIIAEEGLLRAETLRFEDEVRDITKLDLPEGKPSSARVKKLRTAIRSKTRKTLDEDALRSDEAEKLRKLAEKKFDSKKDVVEISGDETGDEEGGEVIDLVEALRKSLGEGGRKAPKKASRSSSSLEKLTRQELYERAKKADVEGRSSMTKKELIKALS